MSYQWLDMRITEEADRRQREAKTLACLPGAFQELRGAIAVCLSAYCEAFGAASAELTETPAGLRVTAYDRGPAGRVEHARVDVSLVTELPGIRITSGAEPVLIDMGVMPDGEVFYRLHGSFLTMEDVTRSVLDRVLFPKLGE